MEQIKSDVTDARDSAGPESAERSEPLPVAPAPEPAPPQSPKPEAVPLETVETVEASGSPQPSPAHIPRSPTPVKDTPSDAPAPETPATPAVHANIPLTMVQSSPENGPLTARQLGQRARRARERELQAQGLYTPKRRTSSSATMPDLTPYGQLPPQQLAQSQDTTMQSADEDGDDDGEGEPETDVSGAPAVPPHPASHLIPPIAVLAPVATPSRASLAQRARRDRERQIRLGVGSTSPQSTFVPPAAQPAPIPFNPNAPQVPPTLTRGQLAQRARRARERVERAAKTNTGQASDTWTPSLGAQDGGMSSAGEAVFAVAPPVNGSPPGFATTVSGTNPGYGVGLGAAHVPQQLNRAQLAQRARRARERQQRLSDAAAHATGTARAMSASDSSVPPASPTALHHLSDASRTSLSPSNAPAPLTIGAQFNQVFKSLTAGDNGVSRAVADAGAGALTSKDDRRAPSHSPPTTEPPKDMDVDADAPGEDNVDQLSEEEEPKQAAPTPAPAPAPTSKPASESKPVEPKPAPTPVPEPEPKVQAPPEAHMANVSVGA